MVSIEWKRLKKRDTKLSSTSLARCSSNPGAKSKSFQKASNRSSNLEHCVLASWPSYIFKTNPKGSTVASGLTAPLSPGSTATSSTKGKVKDTRGTSHGNSSALLDCSKYQPPTKKLHGNVISSEASATSKTPKRSHCTISSGDTKTSKHAIPSLIASPPFASPIKTPIKTTRKAKRPKSPLPPTRNVSATNDRALPEMTTLSSGKQQEHSKRPARKWKARTAVATELPPALASLTSSKSSSRQQAGMGSKKPPRQAKSVDEATDRKPKMSENIPRGRTKPSSPERMRAQTTIPSNKIRSRSLGRMSKQPYREDRLAAADALKNRLANRFKELSEIRDASSHSATSACSASSGAKRSKKRTSTRSAMSLECHDSNHSKGTCHSSRSSRSIKSSSSSSCAPSKPRKSPSAVVEQRSLSQPRQRTKSATKRTSRRSLDSGGSYHSRGSTHSRRIKTPVSPSSKSKKTPSCVRKPRSLSQLDRLAPWQIREQQKHRVTPVTMGSAGGLYDGRQNDD